MIVGLGTDIVDMERVEKIAERFGERFAGHILHPEELELWREGPQATFLAGRFADRVIALTNGRIAFDGPPATVLEPAALEAVFGLPMMVIPDPESGQPIALPRPDPALCAAARPAAR